MSAAGRLRLVAGRLGGRRISAPRGRDTRPTGERVREALFNVLGERVVGARVADLFAGSGALGLEALSRGAAWVDFYESGRAAQAALRGNIAALGVAAECAVVKGALPESLAPGPAYDLALLDPPWGQGLAGPAVARLAKLGRLAADAVVVVEARWGAADDAAAWAAAGLEVADRRRYGDTGLTLLVAGPPA